MRPIVVSLSLLLAVLVHAAEEPEGVVQKTRSVSKICPDGRSQCPDSSTCCEVAGGRWGCCPLVKAVCCSDKETCCPNGYTCGSGGTCQKGSEIISSLNKFPSLKKTHQSPRVVQKVSIICPDGQSQCPNASSCCKLASGQWGCCPVVKAVCCTDKETCCPNGYTCGSGGTCEKGSEIISSFKKFPSLKKTHPRYPSQLAI